jgi:hypothetical protein
VTSKHKRHILRKRDTVPQLVAVRAGDALLYCEVNDAIPWLAREAG